MSNIVQKAASYTLDDFFLLDYPELAADWFVGECQGSWFVGATIQALEGASRPAEVALVA